MITRGSNTYGPNQFPEKIVPLFITNLSTTVRVPVYGDGLQVRDWLYVEDHARAFSHVLERGEAGSVYNIGGRNAVTNLDLTRMLVEGCGRSMDTHVEHVTDRPGHDRRYAVNCDAAARARAGSRASPSTRASRERSTGIARNEALVAAVESVRRREGRHPGGRARHAASPADEGDEQAFASGLRPADDLLSARRRSAARAFATS